MFRFAMILIPLVMLAGAVSAEVQTRKPGVRECSPDLSICIAPDRYLSDTCFAMSEAARQAGLNRDFFTRLIWRESRFDPNALSPAGARGIAQFIDGTAALRDLADPYNPAEALQTSARYLAELRDRFGSLGLAAVAYNAGERRASEFLDGNPFLPYETRAYVSAITGLDAESWRADPPDQIDLSLDPARDFFAACEALDVPEFDDSPAMQAWGVMVAAPRTDAAARRIAGSLQRRYSVLTSETMTVTRRQAPGLPGRRYVAQVTRPDRPSAITLCDRLTASGGSCRVIRN
ncbi:lytic transglycosylase domain-containing protein [Pontibrevibacter nitratireducens]|uniref:Lytic transglycosylase domain-containing protein n=2 Tax=Pontivivens nitratireducens TaxID=2758038 RepID=A0A6G7VMJ0_9RHOB|nr:lytic transglycosylase domain-containing protein [Pontibrevibacter nitratireducens]